jgi:hypothetical protein
MAVGLQGSQCRAVAGSCETTGRYTVWTEVPVPQPRLLVPEHRGRQSSVAISLHESEFTLLEERKESLRFTGPASMAVGWTLTELGSCRSARERVHGAVGEKGINSN